MLKKLTNELYIQVILGMLIGAVFGQIFPAISMQLKFICDIFIKLLTLLISPIIFCTLVKGIANYNDSKLIGKISVKAFIYFEVISTIALLLGLLVGHLFQPGMGLDITQYPIDNATIANYSQVVQEASLSGYITHLVPTSFVGAFTGGNILSVILIAILFSLGVQKLGNSKETIIIALDRFSQILFNILESVIKLAPLSGFAAIGFVVAKFGLASLLPMLKFILCFFLSCVFFIFVILGSICLYLQLPLIKILKFIKEEILLVLGTFSSESALPYLYQKLDKIGCDKSVTSIVLPSSFSFNLDGSNIYLGLAILFLAQISQLHFSIPQLLFIIGICMLTSKTAAGVRGSGMITLASTIVFVPQIPFTSLAVLIGIDALIPLFRSVTNLVGNVIATLVVAKWQNQICLSKMQHHFTEKQIVST